METDTRLVALRILIATSLLLSGVWVNAVTAQLQPIPTAPDRQHALDLFNQHRFAEAIPLLRRVLEKDKQDHEAWFFLGLALAKTNDLKNATKSIEQALLLKPSSAAAHNALAYVMLLRNKLANTVSEAHDALRIDSQLAEPHYFIGVARLRMDEPKEALAEAETSIKLDPRYPAAYLLKSQALVSFVDESKTHEHMSGLEQTRERYRDAAEALELFLKLEPNPANKQTWVDQLESLRVFAAFHPATNDGAIHSGSEVTEKTKVLSKPAAGYTEAARHNQTSGTVVLKAVFAADGKVKHILVLRGLPDGLTELSVRAALAIKFIPATINGQPVSTFMQLEYIYKLF